MKKLLKKTSRTIKNLTKLVDMIGDAYNYAESIDNNLDRKLAFKSADLNKSLKTYQTILHEKIIQAKQPKITEFFSK